MTRTGLWTAISLGVALAFCGEAVGQTLDQSFTNTSGGTSQLPLTISGSTSWGATTYVAEINGILASVNIWVYPQADNPNDTITVQIRNVVNGTIGSTILGSNTVTASGAPQVMLTVPFSSTINQIAGTAYAIVVTMVVSNTTLVNSRWLAGYNPGSCNFFSSPDGMNWSQFCNYQPLFQTFVNPVQNFSCTGFQAPFDIPLSLNKKTNRAIPLKAQLFDSNNNLVTPATVGGATPPVVNVSFQSGTSPAVDDTALLDPLGQSSSGNQFSFDSSTATWWFNLATTPFTASRTYTVTMQSGDTSYQVSPQCSGQFVRQ